MYQKQPCKIIATLVNKDNIWLCR